MKIGDIVKLWDDTVINNEARAPDSALPSPYTYIKEGVATEIKLRLHYDVQRALKRRLNQGESFDYDRGARDTIMDVTNIINNLFE